MQIGKTRVIIRPAMAFIIGGVLVGVIGVIGAGWYALGPQQTYGWVNPKRWVFGSDPGAQARLKMPSPEKQNALLATKDGYSEIDANEGFQVIVSEVSSSPNCVYIRNAIDLEKENADGNLVFSFVGSAPRPFPVTFTIRDSEIKTGGKLLWSHTFSVNGDFKKYSENIPLRVLESRKSRFMIIAGHLGATPGKISLRQVALR